MPFIVGETIGPYRITEQLGQGGMATVFKAYHAALDRYVAIKALHPAFKEDNNFLARFQREARVVAKLDHPNIVPIYDFAEHEGRPYLVMKYIEGETLKARLAQRKLSLPEILRVVEVIGSALTYAHSQGILHRDVKPSNVLLANDGQIYLADFGLARIASAGESTMSSDMMLGTPQYISPEQAMGKRELDEGTDIYSFGVLLYELLAGKVPFSADTPYAIIHDHIYSPLPMPRSINPNIPEDVERVLLKALAKDRADRYPTVRSLVEALKSACGGSDASALVAETGDTLAAEIPALLTEKRIPSLAELAPAVPEPTSMGSVPKEEQIQTEAKPQAAVPVPEVEAAPTTVEPQALMPAPDEDRLRVADKPAPRKSFSGISPLQQKFLLYALIFFTILGFCVFAWLGRGVLKNRFKEAKSTIPATTQAPQEVKVPLDLLMEARQKVDQNPGDPVVHLDLALLLIDAQQYDEAHQQLNKVESLMGDFGFYVEHGKMFREQQKWIASAWAFLRAMEINVDWRTAEALDLFHEAVYKAFNIIDAGRVIDIERIRVIDEAISGVARAQAELTAGNNAKAEAIIVEVNRQYDNFTEALLVQARVMARLKNADRAVKILDGLKQIKTLPPWIRDEIGRIQDVETPKP